MMTRKMLGMSAVALSLQASALLATDSTVAWYHFDEAAPGTRLQSSDVILNAVDSSKLSGSPHTVHYGSLDHAKAPASRFMPLVTNDIPDAVYVFDPVGGTTFRNERSFFIAHSNYLNGSTWQPGRQGGLVKVDSDSSLTLDDLTVEMFVLPVYQHTGTHGAMQLCAKQSTAATKFTWSLLMYSDGKPYVTLHDSAGTDMGGVSQFSATTSILDGKWHHVALTVENGGSAGGTAKLYVDGVLENTLTLSDALCYVEDGPLYIAASQLGYYTSGGLIDEVRISGRALSPDEFLRYRNLSNEPTRFLAGFDEGLDASSPLSWPKKDMTGTGGKRSVSGSRNPALDSSEVPSDCILDGDGRVIKGDNVSSLRFRGSTLVYPHSIELEMTEMTVEMFVKYAASSNYMALAQMVKSSNDSIYTTDMIWKITAMSDGSVNLVVKTDAMDRNTSHDFGVNLADGRWHHLAVTFAETENGTRIKMYNNQKQAGGDWVVDGKLDYSQGSSLSLGTYSGYGAFYGWIDEMRISAGVLPVNKFMRARKGGLTLVFR